MQGQRGIEVAAKLTEFIGSAHLHLSLGKSMIGSLLDIDTSHVEIESQVGLGNADLGKLPSKKHTIHLSLLLGLLPEVVSTETYIGTLRRILVTGLRREPDVIQALLEVLALAMLSKENHHSKALERKSKNCQLSSTWHDGDFSANIRSMRRNPPWRHPARSV
jgi:hypothetical protein